MNVRLNNITIKCMLAILLSALFASCKDEMDEYGFDADLRPSRSEALGIKLNVLGDGFEKPTTRGVIEDDFAEGAQVGVLSMKKKNEASWGVVFKNEAVTITKDNQLSPLWSHPDDKAKWQADYNYKFRAFYPHSSEGFNGPAGESSAGYTYPEFATGSTKLQLDYVSAKDPRRNTDLLVSQTVERINNTEVVPLEMKHLLACVNFKFKSKAGQKVTITKFSISGSTNDASCVIKENNDIEWTNQYDNNSDGFTLIWKKCNRSNGTYTISADNNYLLYDKNTEQEASHQTVINYVYSGWEVHNSSFYILPSASENFGAATIPADNELYIDKKYEGLLFIPQRLDRGDVTTDVMFYLKGYNESNPDNIWDEMNDNGQPGKKLRNVLIKRSVYVNIEYYFDDDKNNKWTSLVSLNAGGQLDEWEAGKKYTYTIGLYDYKVKAIIDIEDWTKHEKVEFLE